MKKILAAVFTLALLLPGCEREKRILREPTADEGSQGGEAYERRAYDVSNGKQLFSRFNCNGCHANGGGDAGPALMDDKWIYGSSIAAIADSIREGRPRGMPSFKDRATGDQIWKLAAYVRSLAGQVASDTAPARNDDLRSHEPESRLPATHPTGDARVQVKP
jgi:cytochrome c oxidase cbb3-type subunit 3